MNNNILPSDEFIEYEGQFYTNPQKGLDESSTFIENLRNSQDARNAEINAQTYNLGSAVPSNLGGLIGGEGYWTSRYQTPQSVNLAANLRSAAQAQALNDVLQNELAIQKQRYNNAYKAYRKRYGGGGGSYDPTDGDDGDGDDELVNEKDTSKIVGSVGPAYTPASSGDFEYTPNAPTDDILNIGGKLNTSGKINTNSKINTGVSVFPAGGVRINRNPSGFITDLTYNGKTYTGDAALQQYYKLHKSGSLKPVGK